MEHLKHPLVLVIVFAAVLGLIYVGWNYHERRCRRRSRRRLLLALPATGPDIAVSSTRIRRRRRRRSRRRPTMNFNLDSLAAQFYAAGVHYSTAIQPYAIKLFFGLFLIDLLITWIQYMAEGQLDPTHFLGRLFRHIFSGGFVYLMIVNGFNLDVSGHPELLAHWVSHQRLTGAQSAKRTQGRPRHDHTCWSTVRPPPAYSITSNWPLSAAF